jgi:hypothetical protein
VCVSLRYPVSKSPTTTTTVYVISSTEQLESIAFAARVTVLTVTPTLATSVVQDML